MASADALVPILEALARGDLAGARSAAGTLDPDDPVRSEAVGAIDALAASEAARAAATEDLRTARSELAELRPRATHLEAEVQRLEAEVLVTRNDLLEAWAQIRKMRNTLSWRATTPFRMAARLGRYG